MPATGRYKPEFDAAMESIDAALQPVSGAEEVPLSCALGRRAEKAVVAPGVYPQTRLAGMDGKAVGADGRFVSDRVLGTGEPVPEGTVRVVPEEELESYRAGTGDEPGRNYVAEPETEYLAGDVIVAPGAVIDAATVSQLALFGFESLEVLRRPVIRVLVYGEGPRSGAVSAWLCGFLEGLGDVEVAAGSVSSLVGIAGDAEGADLLVLASDTEPGRYGEMRRDLYDDPVSGWSPGFWKVGLHPCKHVGFGFAGAGVPTLVFPDVLSKTVLSALVFAPIAVDGLLARRTCRMACDLTSRLELCGPFPEAVPVRVELREGAVVARPLPVRDSFSARRVAVANGVIIAHGPMEPSQPYQVLLPGGGVHDFV